MCIERTSGRTLPGGHPTAEIRGVELDCGRRLRAPVVVITTGTFLRGVLHIGERATSTHPCGLSIRDSGIGS